MQNPDPLAVLTEVAPQFSDEEAIGIAATHYGLDVTVESLVSERDQNFRMKTGGGEAYVLKIANAAEEPEVTDFQIQALRHIAEQKRRHDIPVGAPEIVPTLDGASSIRLQSPSATHIARVVTYLSGKPLAERLPSPVLARNLGASLAWLGRALQGFEHPGSGQSLLWDVQQALNLRQLVRHVPEADVARSVTAALDAFETHVQPHLGSTRAQVIHSDMNPDNVVIDPDNQDAVAGVIDFGDMLHAPLIIDVAVACSYLRVPYGDPLELIAEFVAGYHAVTPLEGDEIDILFELIQARLCASITILDWRLAERGPDDPYLGSRKTGEGSDRHFLLRLREIPRESARRTLRQVLASAGG